jgi:cation diffusion facilitator family transporter
VNDAKIGIKFRIFLSMDIQKNNSNTDAINMRFQRMALFVGFALFIVKVVAYWITNSNAILTDALEGLVNILGAGFGVLSLWYSKIPRDKNHPYGHGKIEFISSGFEGLLILVAGGSMVAKAIYSMFFPHDVTINWEGLVLVTFAGIVNYIMGRSMVVQGEKVDSVQLQAGGKHLISDGYSTAGLLVGLAIVWFTGLDALDNVLAIALGAIIGVTGIRIIRKSFAGVMDEADPGLLIKVSEVLEAQRRPAWVDVHNFRMVSYGATVHLDAHITLPWFFTLQESHEEVDKFEDLLHQVFPDKIESSIHAEPCLPTSCKICAFENCPHRKFDFEQRIIWNSDHILEDEHHTLE